MFLLPLVFIWSRRPMKYGRPSKVAALTIFLFGSAILSFDALPRQFGTHAFASDDVGANSKEGSQKVLADYTPSRLREGAKFGATVGTFARDGRRWTFEFEMQSATARESGDDVEASDGSTDENLATARKNVSPKTSRLRVLENLALQRVTEAIKNDSKDVRWTVTGMVTEFEGDNWLLLSTTLRAPSNNSLTSNR